MFYYKVFKRKYNIGSEYGEDFILAVCDKELVGRKFEKEGIELDVKKGFYRGKEGDEEKIKELSNKATIINAVGEKCITILIKEGHIKKENIKKVQGIWHAQMVKI